MAVLLLALSNSTSSVLIPTADLMYLVHAMLVHLTAINVLMHLSAPIAVLIIVRIYQATQPHAYKAVFFTAAHAMAHYALPVTQASL